MPPRYCVQCRHFGGFGMSGASCFRPTGQHSPVTGEALRLGAFASLERASSEGCGPEARFFAPRTWLQRWETPIIWAALLGFLALACYLAARAA
jgi:hypothetical protein